LFTLNKYGFADVSGDSFKGLDASVKLAIEGPLKDAIAMQTGTPDKSVKITVKTTEVGKSSIEIKDLAPSTPSPTATATATPTPSPTPQESSATPSPTPPPQSEFQYISKTVPSNMIGAASAWGSSTPKFELVLSITVPKESTVITAEVNSVIEVLGFLLDESRGLSGCTLWFDSATIPKKVEVEGKCVPSESSEGSSEEGQEGRA